MATAVATFASSRKHSRVRSTSILVTDALLVTAAALIAARPDHIPVGGLLAEAALTLVFLAASGTYRRSFGGSVRDEWYAAGAALILAAIPVLCLTFAHASFRFGRPAVVEFVGLSFIAIAISRTIVHSNPTRNRLAIVGDPDLIDLALVHVRPRRDDAVLSVPLLDVAATLVDGAAEPPWVRGAVAWGANRVIVTEELRPEQLLRVMEIAGRNNIAIAIAPTRLRQQAYTIRVEREGDLTLLYPRPLPICAPVAAMYKRVLDLALTIPVLLVSIPILAACAIAIKLDSAGPVIYRQTRVGRNGKPFEMLKFRSMPVDAEAETGPVWADPSKSRVTRVGRFLRRTSLDELPQLVNVLRGEMSLIGPRPERPYFVDRFRRELPRYDERLLVRPGITGWSQISMSRVLETNDAAVKLQGDLFYLAEWSPLLDAQIIIKTAIEFLFHRVA